MSPHRSIICLRLIGARLTMADNKYHPGRVWRLERSHYGPNERTLYSFGTVGKVVIYYST